MSDSLRTIALADPLDIELPGRMSIVGSWQFDTRELDPAQLDLLVRYNDRAANTFFPGEDGLVMLGFDREWKLADSMYVDKLDHWIIGEFSERIEYLAVAVPWDANSPLGLAVSTGSGVTPTPEPSSFIVTLEGILLLISCRTRPSTAA